MKGAAFEEVNWEAGGWNEGESHVSLSTLWCLFKLELCAVWIFGCFALVQPTSPFNPNHSDCWVILPEWPVPIWLQLLNMFNVISDHVHK